MILAGLPATTALSGTSKFTKESGAINASLPILIFPTTTALAPMTTLSPIVGLPCLLPLFTFPSVTPCAMLQLLPMITLLLITIFP